MSSTDPKVLTLPEVTTLTTLSKPTIYKYVREGRFPRQVRLGPNRVVWRRADVVNWLDARQADCHAA